MASTMNETHCPRDSGTEATLGLTTAAFGKSRLCVPAYSWTNLIVH